MTILDLEYGRPDVLTAERLLLGGLSRARSAGERTVKLIHGYGSHGVGGAIRRHTRALLRELEQTGRIASFLPGEDFGPISEGGRAAIARDFSLTRDPDYGRANSGITLVFLR